MGKKGNQRKKRIFAAKSTENMTDKAAEYTEGIGWRYKAEHSMLRRMAEHDYQSRCIYMITLTLKDRGENLLGTLAWQGEERKPENAAFAASALGCKVSDELHAIENDCPQIRIIALQLMPDHLHAVVFVRERTVRPLGKYIGMFKNRCNKHYWSELKAKGLLGEKGTGKPPSLFSGNYNDTVLMHEGQLENMVQYVRQNPYRALVKRDNPQLFRVVEELTVSVPAKQAQTEQSAEAVKMTFAAVGNRWLLDRPMRLQVRCHNNLSEENMRLIEKQKEYFLDRAAKGGVIISPCISTGEKTIARAALEKGVPLIVILENGFAPMYKPQGKYFEACAEGLLLMLAPWPHHNERRTITRQQCLALNEMARMLSTEEWSKELEERLKQEL